MAALVFAEMPWHEGERKMHDFMSVPELDNPTVPRLSSQAAAMLQRAPLLAVGTLDSEGRPWTTLWGGEPGFSRGLPQMDNHVAIKVPVAKLDPVVESLLGSHEDAAAGGGMREGLRGKMVACLAIDLETRKRVKIAGRAVAGALAVTEPGGDGNGTAVAQLLLGIEQSLGNCPKYLNSKRIRPCLAHPKLLSDTPHLSEEALRLLYQADTFFISSSHNDKDMDTNHRGGPPGFVRVLTNDECESGTKLVWPEYSGNRLYQTLGNLTSKPLAGLVFPDFETGDVLYLTGSVEILVAQKAARMLPHSNLAVVFAVQAARFVKDGLCLRGEPLEPSPYNPSVRPLASESKHSLGPDMEVSYPTVRLIGSTSITPTISRFRFAFIEDSAIPNQTYKAGQWVALDFSSSLYYGYSHMKDDDPSSLNDDFIRSFTISSSPSPTAFDFEITVRKIGRVTNFLHESAKRGTPTEAVLRGFGGDFVVKAPEGGGRIAFIAGGVGITPLLAATAMLEPSALSLYWTLQAKDVGLAVAFFESNPAFIEKARIFLTGPASECETASTQLSGLNVSVKTRRLQKEDLEGQAVEKWYICTSVPFRRVLLEWLSDIEVEYEDFGY